MAFDSARAVTVMFGGFTAGGNNDKTWEWDGNNWTKRNPVTAPSARSAHAMAYDSGKGVTVLFGGDTSMENNETWEWDGANWSQRTPAPAPSPRFNHKLAYDTARGVTVLFGGLNANFNDETWEWTGPNPTISQQPADQNVTAGQAAAFSVTAGGTGPFTYQWRKNGAPLSDAAAIAGSTTATVTINPTAGADGGTYDCAVSNGCGVNLSRAAMLTVTPAAVPTTSTSAPCGTCGAGAATMMPICLLGLFGVRRRRRGPHS
jgi:hypothetical protein